MSDEWGGLVSSGAIHPVLPLGANLAAKRSAQAKETVLGEGSSRPAIDPARSGNAADDAASFTELFAECASDVARTCRRMLGAGAAAEDAASEVFLRGRRAFDSFDPERPFRPWLLKIASNQCIDQLRRQSLEGRLFDPGDLESDPPSASGPSPLSRLLWAEERETLLVAIESLPTSYRLPLLLRYWNELDYAGIAEMLGIKSGQVGSLLFRAKRRLREALQEVE